MGDMKTPDFDDLLAAFDIPDMVDPKAAIESGPSDDHENQLKQANSGAAINEEVSSSGQDVGVSVIVKNTRNMDNGEHGGTLQKKVGQLHTNANTHFSVGNGLHNGLLSTILPNNRYTKNGWRATREEGLPVNTSTSTLNQFSPISSAEEFDDDDKIEVDDPMDKHCSQSFTKPTPNNFTVNLSYHKREDQNPKEPISLENVSKPTAKSDSGQTKPEINNNTLSCAKPDYTTKLRKHEDEAKEAVPKPHGHVGNEVEELPQLSSVSVLGLAQAKIKSSAKLSSCIAAIAALSAKKSSAVDSGLSECPTTKIKSIPISPHGESTKEAKESSSAPETQQERELALEVAKRLLSRQPDSPGSVTSEGSGKGSPASPTGTTPVIPKVRIKTIKTSSGHIKRTVTRVLPEFDVEGPKRKEHSSDSCVRISPVLTSSTSNTNISSPTQTSLSTTVVATSGGPTLEVTKQMTIKPVATAFLPVSAVKTAGSQVINLKLANNTTVKATVIPAASVQSASSAILKAANALQQQTVMVPASSLAKAKLVPKTVHFTNLNLLPQASTPSDLHQALSSCKQLQNQKPQQQMKLQVCQVPKKLSRVQVFGSAQSSVVDAFNKVLSSVNPVPVYVPNLSPPTSACISIPSRGYKCLECGDSFALEKSLTQHYERRSVRIEVTCNHCAKNLVFYNKCSLLSHARGHKDKGMVMQCSHLILKPIPAEQMITTSPPAGSNVTLTVVNAQTQSSKTAGSGTYTAVISAPGSAPLMAAMPLEDDVTKLSRHSLKCLECNQMFQDANSLAMHYQQASESNGQKTCSICQMLLPNQCSFVSHQRIHQHKSPYICPECGASCRSVHFQSHVTRSCLHYTRRVGYRCVHCSVIFDEIAALKSHIQNTHCEVFYKCPVCPMAFKSAPGTHSHANTQHPGVKIAEPKLIYKCSMCDTVFTLQSLLHTHFDQHIGNHKVSVFKCPDCSVHYAQKQLMLDHIKTTHGTLKTIEGPPNLGINLPLSTKPTHSNSNTNSPNSNKDGGGNVNGQDWGDKKPPPRPLKTTNSNVSGDLKNHPGPGYTCGGCDLLFTSREVFVTHMKRDHGKTLKKHPCRQCDKSFSSPHSLCRHNRLKHKGLRKVYTCPHCPALSQPFTKRVLLEQHVELMHGIRDPELKSMDADRMEAIPDKTVNPKRKQEEAEGSLGPHCRDSDPQPLKKLKVNVLKVHRCAVCGFTSEDLASFHGHIPQHKSDGSSYQCQECGLCYTSHHSLARHLFIVHRLKDPQGLVRRGGGVGRGDGDDQSQRENQLDVADENDEGKPSTRCKVCGKVFETEGHLNTHMRTHGMAFIKSKRLSAAEK